jgi:hypothetical protein
VFTADRFSDDTPPEVPGRADNGDVHRVLLPRGYTGAYSAGAVAGA